jgi:FAD dependent oxidoreductase
MNLWKLLPLTLIVFQSTFPVLAAPPRTSDETVECDLLVAGGGLAGSATAYEALLAGKTVCMTEITDWIGGQISSQGTSALDERPTQREKLFFPRGYLEFREKIRKYYGKLNPGDCWVSESCYLPSDGHKLLFQELKKAEKKGKGKLNWYPSTVIKELDIKGSQILSSIAIQHSPQPNTPPLNTEPLSQIFNDAYTYEDSPRLKKKIVKFVPRFNNKKSAQWYVIDATETGELIGLADVPYKLGIDPRSYEEPSSSSATADPYCTQGFTYTFAMEKTKEPQTHEMPPFYPQYAPYYSYELPRLANFDLVFTYRRIWSPEKGKNDKFGGISFSSPTVGDISMQNWTWGNDYRPGTSQDNHLYSRDQLQANGQLNPGGWMGGFRQEALQKAEEKALGYFYWLVAGTTDSQLGDGVKQVHPEYRFLKGFDSPMGTAHGLSKYPYMREGRRIIGRPSFGYPDGFMVSEIDISRNDFRKDEYKQLLSENTYQAMRSALAFDQIYDILKGDVNPDQAFYRTRAKVFPDSIGIGHYAIDFHPCMTLYPAETPANTEREGERRGQGQAYPFQIPLRALIPQEIDNLLIAGKSIATSHIAAAAYRVHSFEWSTGAAAAMTAIFALDNDLFPYQLVDDLPKTEPDLRRLQQKLNETGNPTAFPETSIFNQDWSKWK